MRTYMAKDKEIQRNWYLVDAEGEPLGRLASRVAYILRGKHKPEFTPHVDCGDYVVIINAEKIKLTGKKGEQKTFYKYTGYPGGLKKLTYKELLEFNPEKAITLAVKRMLPKNKLGRKMIKKLKVYKGSSHPHMSQNPKKINPKDIKK